QGDPEPARLAGRAALARGQGAGADLVRGRGARRGLHPCPPPRHGRLQPGARGPGRGAPSLAGRAHPRGPGFHRSRRVARRGSGGWGEAEASPRLDRTFFLVSSKSGRTIETLSQYRYFRTRLEEMRVERVGHRFAAVTDPGSALERLATEEGMRRVFLNPA